MLANRLFSAPKQAEGTRQNKAGKTVVDADLSVTKDGKYCLIFPSRVPMEAVNETENGNPYVQVNIGALDHGVEIYGKNDKGEDCEAVWDVGSTSFRLMLKGVPKG